MFKLKYWKNENSRPQIREGLSFSFAYALATKAGNFKSQIISQDGIIEFEARTNNNGE